MNKAVFLDKDGTLVNNYGYPKIIPSDRIYLDETVDGLKKFQNAGYLLIIISNQSWISKGRITEQEVVKIFESVTNQYKSNGVTINGFYYCPHKDSDNCKCRKPEIGLIERAVKDFNIDIKNSFIIGDRKHDILLGRKFGLKTGLVKTGEGWRYNSEIKPDYEADDLNEIARIMLKE